MRHNWWARQSRKTCNDSHSISSLCFAPHRITLCNHATVQRTHPHWLRHSLRQATRGRAPMEVPGGVRPVGRGPRRQVRHRTLLLWTLLAGALCTLRWSLAWATADALLPWTPRVHSCLGLLWLVPSLAAVGVHLHWPQLVHSSFPAVSFLPCKYHCWFTDGHC